MAADSAVIRFAVTAVGWDCPSHREQPTDESQAESDEDERCRQPDQAKLPRAGVDERKKPFAVPRQRISGDLVEVGGQGRVVHRPVALEAALP